MRDLPKIDTKKVALILVGVGLASFAGLAALVAILTPVPVSTVALLAFFPCALASAWVVVGFRTPPMLSFVMVPILLVLAPAIAGHVATIQQPWLLEPLAPLVCEADETLGTSWHNRAIASDGREITVACEGPRGVRRTYLPELAHMLCLVVLFGANYLLAFLVRRR
jgi:hypothetical protein